MTLTFLTGLIGSLILVLGAAWHEKKIPKLAVKSTKNWLFAIGGLLMFAYAILGYLNNGSIFFVILQILVCISSILMMIDIDDKIDSIILAISGIGLIIWSLYLFQGYNTLIFIIGLLGIGLGYSFRNGTLRRDIALTLGSILIAFFSYLESSWIFFWLNLFFAIFSLYYLVKNLKNG